MPIPSYNLPQIFNMRDKICDGMTNHIGTAPNAVEFDRFVDDIYNLLPKDLPKPIVYESLVHLISQEISPTVMRETAWRLAGNISLIKAKKVVYPWKGQGEPEWVPVQILEATLTKTWKGDPAYQYRIRILAGSSCPLTIYKIWPAKICSYLARKIGFSPPWKEYPYRDGHELVSMRFLAEIDPKFCRDQKPGFDQIYCTGSLEEWNKSLLKARAHEEPPCPFGYTHFCWRCPIGYDLCKAGVHPKTYQLKTCLICGEETNHDPTINGLICVQCRDRTRKDK